MNSADNDAEAMRNITFTVPVRVDSPDRLANLLAVVRALRTSNGRRWPWLATHRVAPR